MTLALQFYDFLRFFHVVIAMVWVGGTVMVQITAELAFRSSLPGRAAAFAKETSWIGQFVFTPASLVVVGLGFWLVANGHWGYHFWTIASLVGFVASFVVGAGFLGPKSGKLVGLIEAHGADSAVVKQGIRSLVFVARADTLLLLVIVFLMATKLGQ